VTLVAKAANVALVAFSSTAQRIARRASRSLHGSIAVSPGTEPMSPRCRATDWCEWPARRARRRRASAV